MSQIWQSGERWKKAQAAEKRFWLIKKGSWQNLRQFWQEMLADGFNLGYEFFNGKSVLEIGCGPHGIIFQLDNVRSRVGLEPMNLNDLIQDYWKKKLAIITGIGENMPFSNDSFDVIISFNNLDHCANPHRVIQEAHRLLRHEGHFLLLSYILRNEYSFLRSVLNKFDRPHPHHFTFDEILRMLNDNSFRVEYKRYDKGTELPNNGLKNIIANSMMNTGWFWSRKD